ncbi:hypothetical protein TWF694_007384 [Orbilia ellipsospora]|uniref:UFSP1/2/DUB catalytic domain-containing protein n=1 Tax=Orbilia ellipsospora TaxID=2528407 RepID=A0AAV9XJ70_9PEZI
MAFSSFRPSRPRVPEIACPLCTYTADDPHIIQLHFEAVHDRPRSVALAAATVATSSKPPPPPPKPENLRRQIKYKVSLVDEDPYDPFKYQIPNNNSQEVVGHPVYREEPPARLPYRGSSSSAARPAPRPAAPSVDSSESELEYIPCEWKGCGEPVSLMELEEHIAMHEEMMEGVDDPDNDYIDDDLPPKNTTAGQRERQGEALMEASSKKRHHTKKVGPSDRLRKKIGQMERRLESEAQSQDGELISKADYDDDDEDVVKIQKITEEVESSNLSDDDNMSTSKEYDIISKGDITEDDEKEASSELEKSKEETKKDKHRGHHHHHHSGKKLQKQGHGGYESTEPRRNPKRSTPSVASVSSVASSWVHKPRFKKSELGPYANEKRMPDWLKDALKAGGKEVIVKYIGTDGHIHIRKSYENETAHLIPVIRQLLNLDPNVAKAYLCHPCVKHVFKEHHGANGFCGYRNIQMLASYCRKNLVPGCERLFEERIPTVIQIQKWIENAWDMGINAHAREETGGILYTRKYIGSSEVEAMFTSFGTATIPRQFSEPNQQANALRHVFNYFTAGYEQDSDKVVQTDKPPIYFQHHGHSMTIVGIEQYKDGTLCFICFDPMFSPSQNIKALVGQKRLRANISHGKLLKPFRRGGPYLKRYKIFEMVELAPFTEPESSLYE